MIGWSTGAFDGSRWLSVKKLPDLKGHLLPSDGPPIKRIEVEPRRVFESRSGKTLIDSGQIIGDCLWIRWRKYYFASRESFGGW